jgi:DNA-binding PadR family transcriptional regulator
MTRRPHISRQTRAVLSALAQRPQAWRHGYDLARELGLKSGTLYPLLIRLADHGLLQTEWQASPQGSGPPRHIYRLSADGLALARAQAAETAEPPALAGRVPA